MKVLFSIINIPPDYGGGYLRVFKLAARFKSYGNLYKIVTYTKKERFGAGMMGATPNDVIFERNKILTSFFSLPWHMIKNAHSFDVFYVASVRWHTLFPSMMAKLLKKKVVHGVTLSMVDSPAAFTNKFLLKPYYAIKNIQFRLADYIFVNSPLLVEECKRCGYNDEVVKLINNPVDTQKYILPTKERKKEIRRMLNLPIDRFTILFVGSFNKRKGCDLFPTIFNMVLPIIKQPITFVMCGQKGYPETEDVLRATRGVFEKAGSELIVREEVGDTSPYYQASDMFLFPTTNEGMPNVVLEAMASGCMIVCNTLPGITDYVLDAQFLVSNNNIEDYTKKIVDFYHNSALYSKKITENRRLIEREYSLKSVDDLIKDILR